VCEGLRKKEGGERENTNERGRKKKKEKQWMVQKNMPDMSQV
jgi:hypothetical protein